MENLAVFGFRGAPSQLHLCGCALGVPRAAEAAEAEALWREAYEAERERGALLAHAARAAPDPSGISSAPGAGLAELAVAGDAEGGWEAAYARLRARHAALERAGQERRSARLAEAPQRPAPPAETLGPAPLPPAAAAPASPEAPGSRPKVLSIVNWPDFDDETDEQEVQDALDVLAVTDFPILVAFLGIPACGDEAPTLGAVREALALGDAEVEAAFRCSSARSYGGRVCEFRGALSPELPPGRVGQLDGEALLFVFARGDLPQTERFSEGDRLAVALLVAVALALCCSEALESLPEVEEESVLLAILRLAPLAAGAAARRQAASLHGVELQEAPLPSWSAGHLGSTWSPIGFAASRDGALATAAAAPAATLLVIRGGKGSDARCSLFGTSWEASSPQLGSPRNACQNAPWERSG
ncbi:unnamed protein product [Prorocentrum cordatum]|uniref:Uncharacterized protein n=1 Tax=Prorocentrum cordatum TaxID=2364126 RepID=A0ABN9Y0C8_9DINO|nr:unnamed protein product [Polarella glacialis]